MPGVYLLECRPVNSDEDWTGLDLQLVVSENSRISISGQYSLWCSFGDFPLNSYIFSSLLPLNGTFWIALDCGDDIAKYWYLLDVFKPYRITIVRCEFSSDLC